MRLLADSAKSHGAAIAEAVQALDDSKITLGEVANLDRRIMDAIADLAALRGSLVAKMEADK
jgi:hypothetical protein